MSFPRTFPPWRINHQPLSIFHSKIICVNQVLDYAFCIVHSKLFHYPVSRKSLQLTFQLIIFALLFKKVFKLDYKQKITKIFTDDCSIIGKERFLNSAVIIPLLNVNGKLTVIFEKRSNAVRQPGEISFPGGHFDSAIDKDFRATAIRETFEELDIDTDKIEVLGKLGTLVAPMGVLVEAFVAILNIDNPELLKIDKREVDYIFTVLLDYFIVNNPEQYFTRIELHPYSINEKGERQEHLPVKELGLPDKYALPWTRGTNRVLVYKTNNEIIWGITAELIFEFAKKLRDA